jgi:hypothetical protein
VRGLDDEALKPFRLDRLSRWATLAVFGWAVMLTAFVFIFLFSPGLVTGFAPYLMAGHSWLDGLDIYSFKPNKGFVYSPLAAVFFSWAALIPAVLANIVWRLMSAAMLLGGLWSLFRFGPFAHIPRHLRGLVFLLVLPVAAGNLDSGQANAIVIGLVMVAVAAAFRERWTIAAIAVAGAFSWKIYPVVLGLLLVLSAPTKFTWRLALCLVVMALVPFLFQHPAYVAEQYRQWFATRMADNRFGYPIQIAPLDLWFLLVRLGHLPLSVAAYNVLRVAAGAAIAWFCLCGRRKEWPRERTFGGMLCFVCVWMLLLGPASESLSYLILVPAAAIGVVESFSIRIRPGARALAVLGCGLLLLAVLRVGFFPRLGIPWLLALQPAGALFYLGYCLHRYLRGESWGAGQTPAPDPLK